MVIIYDFWCLPKLKKHRFYYIGEIKENTCLLLVRNQAVLVFGNEILRRVVEVDRYPIMTREHKVVSSIAPIPVGVLVGYNIDVVGDNTNQSTVKCVWFRAIIQEISNPFDAHRDKEGMCLVMMAGQKWGISTGVQLIDEMAFNGVDVGHGPVMEDGYFSFLVSPYLESFHHLYVAPAHPPKQKPTVQNYLLKSTLNKQ